MIRKAEYKDIDSILKLLKQISIIHHNLRPDLFKASTKYSKEELNNLLSSDNTIIYVYEDNNEILGYIFINLINIKDDILLNDIKTIYIDDLCIDENHRCQKIGEKLYNHVKEYAKENGYTNITLNVWEGNEAIKFNKKLGLKPQKTTLEEKL